VIVSLLCEKIDSSAAQHAVVQQCRCVMRAGSGVIPINEKFVNLGIDPPKGVLCYGLQELARRCWFALPTPASSESLGSEPG
jgi:hypothetical protein